MRFVYWFDLRDWDIHGEEKDVNVLMWFRFPFCCCWTVISVGICRRLITSKRPRCETENGDDIRPQAAI